MKIGDRVTQRHDPRRIFVLGTDVPTVSGLVRIDDAIEGPCCWVSPNDLLAVHFAELTPPTEWV
jgi:hypothetical protein